MSNSAEYAEPRCVSLCAAMKAYGERTQWWHHEPQCPRREFEKAALSDASQQDVGD